MRLSGNFHPEWGYLAPAPSFMRTARVVAVATAIGATAGAGVVLSLADRPAPVMAAGAGQTLVVVHSLVQPAAASVPAAAAASAAAESVVVATPPAAPAPVTAAAPVAAAIPVKAETQVQVSAPVQATALSTVAAPAVPSNATASAEEAPPFVAPPSAKIEASEPAADAMPVAPEQPTAPAVAVKKPHLNEHEWVRPPLAVAAAPKRKPADTGLAPILKRLFSAHTGNTRAN